MVRVGFAPTVVACIAALLCGLAGVTALTGTAREDLKTIVEVTAIVAGLVSLATHLIERRRRPLKGMMVDARIGLLSQALALVAGGLFSAMQLPGGSYAIWPFMLADVITAVLPPVMLGLSRRKF